MVNVRKGWIKIRVSEDRMGNLHLEPIRRQVRERCIAHLRQVRDDFKRLGITGPNAHVAIPKANESLVFLQEGMAAEEFRENHLSPQNLRDMRGGWDVTILMDPWVFLHFIGFDAHEEVRL